MKNKKYWLLTTAITLLPVLIGLLLWEKLPDKLPTHFGIHGTADGFSSKGFAVFGIPLMMLAFQWICYGCTLLDKQNRGHNKKVLDLVGLIFPGMSIVFGVLIYTHGMGVKLRVSHILLPLLGLMFLAIGNWMPKIKQNATLGIKLKWTLYNEENWNKTHRFSGWCWVIGGLLLILLSFLSDAAFVPCLLGTLLLMVLLPTVYSWKLAKRQQREGTYTQSRLNQTMKQHPAVKILSLVLVTVILLGVTVLMFSGDISYTCTHTALTIEADFWNDSTIPFEKIESIEYRDTAPDGTRQWGFGSARLLMGAFSNDEFGLHTRYSYAGTDAYIVLTCGGEVLVLNAESIEVTRKLYDTLTAKIPEVSQ